MKRSYYIAGFSLGLIAVVLGAFATHGLKPSLSADAISSFETGVRYQMYHAFLLLVIGNMQQHGNRMPFYLLYMIIAGVLLFSGSIYLLATNTLTAIDFKILGPVTPLGGSLLIFCWGILIWNSIKLKKK
ncbi:MAG TPA: DUF423 domain-containing protein [Gillisia sp.]|nr:DUF423 domain-containing protein [Gillisia sp.]